MTRDELAQKLSETLETAAMSILEAAAYSAQAQGLTCKQALEELLPDFIGVIREGAMRYDAVSPLVHSQVRPH